MIKQLLYYFIIPGRTNSLWTICTDLYGCRIFYSSLWAIYLINIFYEFGHREF